jgi:hypothetical protein
MAYRVGRKGEVVFVREQGAFEVKYQPVVFKKYKRGYKAVVMKDGKDFQVWVSNLFAAPEKFAYNQAVA